jgi:hypothetical protein
VALVPAASPVSSLLTICAAIRLLPGVGGEAIDIYFVMNLRVGQTRPLDQATARDTECPHKRPASGAGLFCNC